MLRTLLASALLFVGAAAQSAEPKFVDAYEALSSELNTTGFSGYEYYDALDSLKKQFDYICGDTFCEGEFWDLASLEIACSLAPQSREIGQCAWTLAGSYGEVNPQTGKIEVTSKVFVCDFGIKGTDADLASFLKKAMVEGDGHDGLRDAVVPGTQGKTLMDVISDCL